LSRVFLEELKKELKELDKKELEKTVQLYD